MTKLLWLQSALFFTTHLLLSQNIGHFVSVKPLNTQPDSFIIPTTHTFQYLLKTGDSLNDQRKASTHFDFTGYIPIQNSSEGWLSISSEKENAEVIILHIKLDSNGLWNIETSGKVDFYSPNFKQNLAKVSNFCSGGVMPWGTVVVAEENCKNGDANKDGYEDLGWLIEINPFKRQIMEQKGVPQKLWKMGRMQHENLCIDSDLKTCYYGADSKEFGYLYKYICKKKGDLTNGKLYVLKMNGDVKATSGKWIRLPNHTKEDCNQTNQLAKKAGATHFAGIEDVEIGKDHKVYFSAKYSGRVYRFKDMGSETSENEIFVDDTLYKINYNNGETEVDFHTGDTGADNLAFDIDGNLWILNDGGNNQIWVADKSHTPQKPQMRLFAETPTGCEPTGITFSPDGKYLFLSLQNPKASGIQTDKAGKQIKFNVSHTLVISRK
ncbi:MAG: DUF839 domain-containing protein [Cytophagales bacterium]